MIGSNKLHGSLGLIDFESLNKVENWEVNKKSVHKMLMFMEKTSFQGRSLGKASRIWKKMKEDKVTKILGLAGSMGTAGQYKLVNWLIENKYVDVLVSTGANISEDIISAMGLPYLQGDPLVCDRELLDTDYFRYYDTYCAASSYVQMEELIEQFMERFCKEYEDIAVEPIHNSKGGFERHSRPVSSMIFLRAFGEFLWSKKIYSIVATAWKYNVPVFCPAICDSAYGDAYLTALQRGYRLQIDGMRDFEDIMGIGRTISDSGVIYVGGGVPKDFTQLMAASLTFSMPKEQKGKLRNRHGSVHISTGEWYYPHKYAIQITSDAPQWGGLSGCTLEEAISWGKTNKDRDNLSTVYCDATIALPLLVHALYECEHPIK